MDVNIIKFKGIMNTEDPTRIPPEFLSVALNIDIDDSNLIHLRDGRRRILTGNYHSLWSNGKICLVVQDGIFKRLMPDNTLIPLLSSVMPDAEMAYTELASNIYFSNNHIVGYVDPLGNVHAFPDITQEFKQRMVGGQILEAYNSRLYAVQDTLLFYSDAAAPMVMDKKKNFISLGGNITMVQAVRDGLYVSHGGQVTFLYGPDPGEFRFVPVSTDPAIPGMSIKQDLSRKDVDPGHPSSGVVAMWMTESGCYMGLPGGQVKLVTSGNFALPDGTHKGAAIWRLVSKDKVTYGQYFGVYRFKPGFGELIFDIDMPVYSGLFMGTTF